MDHIPAEMKLTRLVQEFVVHCGWEDRLEIDHVEKTSRIDLRLANDDLNCGLMITVTEDKHWVSFYMENEITVTERRFTEACLLLNGINEKMQVGKMTAAVGRHFLWQHTVDFEGVESSFVAIKNMVDAGFFALKAWQNAMGRVIFTTATAAEILADPRTIPMDEIDHALPLISAPAPSTLQ